MLSLFATTVAPSVRSAATHLMLRASAAAGVALQQRLEVRVDPCERVFRQTVEAIVEGVFVEVIVAVGALQAPA